MNNGDRGFIARGVITLKCYDGWKSWLPFKYLELADKRTIGKRAVDIFPPKMDVSKAHVSVACVNNYYFLKDASSKGTFVKIGGGKNKRIELHKGMTFAVGRIGFKVQMMEGDCADNRIVKQQIEEEEAKKAAQRSSDTEKNKKKEAELDSDEEFADTDDDDDDTSKQTKGGKRGKLDGPPVMFLATIDKKGIAIKGRIRETSTIGADKEKNKISIPAELAKQKGVSAVHTRIVLEDGHFYLEDAGSSLGTWVGMPKKKWFEINSGDHIMIGAARCRIGMRLNPFQPIQGIIDTILGSFGTTDYQVNILGHASIEQRLVAAQGLKKVKTKKDDD